MILKRKNDVISVVGDDLIAQLKKQGWKDPNEAKPIKAEPKTANKPKNTKTVAKPKKGKK